MFFDGDYGAKRKVNLRGNSKNDQDKKAFLEKQKQEREKRSLEKRQQRAALSIQAFQRGRVAVKRAQKVEREAWDSSLPSQINSPLPVQTLSPLIRSLLFFYNDKEDERRLAKLCALVLDGLNSKDPTKSYFANSATKPWLLQTRQLLELCQRKLRVGTPIFAQLLDFITNPAVLDSFLHNEALSYSISCNLLDHLINRGLFQYVRSAIGTHDTIPLRVALRRFDKRSPPTADVTAKFLGTVLSVPGLVSLLPSAVVSQELRPALAIALACVATPPNNSVLRPYLDSVEDVEGLIGNMLDLAKPFIKESSPESLQSYIVVLNFLLCSLPPNVPQPKPGENDMDTSSSSADQHIPRKPLNLSVITDPTVLKHLFSIFLAAVPTLLPATSPQSHIAHHTASTLSAFTPLGLIALCRLVDTLTNGRWDSYAHSHAGTKTIAHMRGAVLHTLTSSPAVVKTLWQIISRSKEVYELASGRLVDEQEPLVPMLALWAKCFSHILLTMDDQEFFEQQQYFALDEIIHMSRLLNKIVFRMYWTRPPTSAPSYRIGGGKDNKREKDDDLASLRTSLTTFIRQIYDRNARRVFVPENHWIIDDTVLGCSASSVAALWAQEGGSSASTGNEQVAMLLRHIPFVIPFGERVKIFHQLIAQDKGEARFDHDFFNDVRVTIRRNFLFEDGFASLNQLGEKLKRRIRVEFINSEGLREAGIDGGGLTKDFITDLVKFAFDPHTYALFLTTSDAGGQLYPNPSSAILAAEHLTQFEFLGRILGKALYDSILVELPLAPFFLAKLLGKHNYVNDLVSLDPQLHKNLMYLKNYAGNVEDDLALNFTVVDNEFDQGVVKELIPNGKDIPVTNDNRIRYIYLVANHRLNVQIKHQCDAFLRGFSDLIKPEWIRMFSQDELQFLISGSPGGIDLVDFRTHATYHGGYSDSHPVINMFWSVVAEMTPQQQRDLLRFCTSCSRPPLLGFAYLHPPFAIHVSRVESTDPDTYLPSASTCMNLLKLPMYTFKSALREKLLYAISSNSGFDLS